MLLGHEFRLLLLLMKMKNIGITSERYADTMGFMKINLLITLKNDILIIQMNLTNLC